ncbi:hypothetical protein HZF08_16255 [Paenibacillus sp. CGMCC 1.16610]|uniref:TnsA endonuclease N-terminal domain-containing protein n=1 Tax=Paenibacillus anseongense TaxID=2682845 RepID=A0ABW9UJL5_9BACL|nr:MULTISPECIES: hypothetical protein [Paenibacillus]MBA2939866.1 hypothetical protein [Paenibacillus sp. CGMCC 1.16610]MVQ39526.1 hypothetical protein [Paenibacillus anseongense]
MDYNWSTKIDWSKEDKLYARKRNVTNKGSREFEHLIGSIYSHKMKRGVQYESFWGECLFYYLLELDKLTIRYYEQPVKVPINRLTKEHILKEEVHVPDVLTFRDGLRPILIQIKGGNSKVEQRPNLYKVCENFANEQGWDYTLVNPKITMPEIIKENILWLVNYLRPREYYSALIPEVRRRVEYLHKVEVLRLAKSFEPRMDYRHVLPLIFHLIATGVLITNISKRIDQTSEVSYGTIFNDINLLFEKE